MKFICYPPSTPSAANTMNSMRIDLLCPICGWSRLKTKKKGCARFDENLSNVAKSLNLLSFMLFITEGTNWGRRDQIILLVCFLPKNQYI